MSEAGFKNEAGVLKRAGAFRVPILILFSLWVLGGCAGGGGQSGGRYAMTHDAYPDRPPDLSQVPDAVPKVEPRSRGGNSESYQVLGKRYRVLDSSLGYERTGRASFYGRKFQGYDTANGETYDMFQMSAAHRTLPLPTYARVTRPDNNRSVIVRINDRGPFHDDRLIDLSYAAAARLDMLDEGTARVRVTAIDPTRWQARGDSSSERAHEPESGPERETAPSGASYLQVAALGSAEQARTLRNRLSSTLSMPVRIARHDRLSRVQVGPLKDPIMVESARAALAEAGFAPVHRVGGTE